MKKIYFLFFKNLLPIILTVVVSINAHSQAGLNLNFDGNNDYLKTPVLLSGTYSKEAWIKIPDVATQYNNIISGGKSVPANQYHVFWTNFGILSAGHTETFNSVKDNVTLTPNIWYHVAVTYDATTNTMKLYKDGILISTNTGVLPFGADPCVFIGAIGTDISAALANSFFNGSLDDVRIWNTVLTATNILNRKNCELVGNEPGLVAYYKFNQGIAGANNAGITNLINSSTTTGLDGTLFNFALSGTTSNWAAGTAVTPNIATTQISQTLSVSGPTIFSNSSCSDLITTLTPNGTSPVAGSTTAKVWIETSQDPAFVKRHYEITPAANTTTATSRVTIYSTQQEFDDFNLVNTVKLPTGPTDMTGIANLIIDKRGGVSNNNTGLPGTYSGLTTIIKPADADIVWNSNVNRWEITFDVLGFSGFFIESVSAPLPVRWLSITGVINAQKQTVLNWEVQENNVLNYSVEKSDNAVNFTGIATVNSKGDAKNSYNFTDASMLNGLMYFRVKQTDRNARTSYSPIIKLSNNQNGKFAVYPNPVKDMVSITGATIGSTAILTDLTGKSLQQIKIKQSAFTIDMSKYNSGVYVLKTDNGITQKIIKQ